MLQTLSSIQGTISIVLYRLLCYFAFSRLMTTISRILRQKSYLSSHLAFPKQGRILAHFSQLSRQGSHSCGKCRILSTCVFCYSVERFKQGYKPYVQFKVRFLLYCIDFCAILHSEGLRQQSAGFYDRNRT